MPKNPHADFTPALEGYSGQGTFRFWCQMALPLTYDDSLSYYELLCKVVNYLNHTIEDVANAETNVSRLAEAYTQLQNYVNNYFDDLDIEAELRNVLDAMAEDGTLDDLLDPLVQDHLPSVVDDQIDDVVADQIGDAVAGQIDNVVAEQLPPLVDEGIPGEVSDWLTENVDPVGSAVVVDSSLTISGAAADAKVTGDELADLKTQITDISNVLKIPDSGVTTVNESFTWYQRKTIFANLTLKANVAYKITFTFDAVNTVNGYGAISKTDNTTPDYATVPLLNTSEAIINYTPESDIIVNITARFDVSDTYKLTCKWEEMTDNAIEELEANINAINNNLDITNNNLDITNEDIEYIKNNLNLTGTEHYINDDFTAWTRKTIFPGIALKSGTPYRVWIKFDSTNTVQGYLAISKIDNTTPDYININLANKTHEQLEYTPESDMIVNITVRFNETGNYDFVCGWSNTDTFISKTDSAISKINDDIEYTQTSGTVAGAALPYRKLLPSYYFDIVGNNEYMDGKINNIPNGTHIIFFTDTHYPRNAHNSEYMINYVRGKSNIKMVINGGDFIDKHNTTALGIQAMNKAVNPITDACSRRILLALGNHDNNSYGWSTPEELANAIIPYTDLDNILHKYIPLDAVYYDASADIARTQIISQADKDEMLAYFRMNFYCDDIANSIRYIVINTGNNGGLQYDYFNLHYDGEVYLALNWINNAILTTPENYSIVVVGHQFMSFANNTPTISGATAKVTQMLSARKKKINTTITISAQIGNANLTTWMGGTRSVACNYENAPDIDKAFVLSGHTHTDFIIKQNGNNYTFWDGETPFDQNDGDIPVIVTGSDAYRAAGDPPEGYRIPMADGTITEQLFDVVTIQNSVIVLTRFGAGNNRTIPLT